ncbi:flagellar biogenesis protein FliO [Silvibacterium bohemicum]|uniref:Flagellar biogenesis protein FliO n=1 Tax=Silvibacterium bohemicum TaxID=1577686 RepID=A0A841K5L3_9BACT|nr:flagellar biogenesis protein FliO [Silvibacterium bohemicum]
MFFSASSSPPPQLTAFGPHPGGHAPRSSTLQPWLVRFWKRVGWSLQPARSLRIEERLGVGGKKAIMLIACNGRRFLLASSGDSMAPLIEVLPLSRDIAVPVIVWRQEEISR